MIDLRIVRAGQLWNVVFPFDAAMVEAVREVATWDKRARVWCVSAIAEADALRAAAVRATDAASFHSLLRAWKLSTLQARAMDVTRRLEPDGLKLDPYQRDGVAFVAARESTLLAWDMGLGKTPSTICAINSFVDMRLDEYLPKPRVLVVCPANLKHNWYREAKKWLVNPALTVGISQGNYLAPTDLCIINYDILHRHKGALDEVRWDMIVLDEAHYIAHAKSRRTKMILGSDKGPQKIRPLWAPRRLALTGTPMRNRPQELWPILNWLDPKRWPSSYWFEQEFCGVEMKCIGRRGGELKYVRQIVGAKNLDKLNARLRGTVMLRQTKAQVLPFLPKKRRQVIEFDLAGADKLLEQERAEVERLNALAAPLRAAIAEAKIANDYPAYAAAVDALDRWLRKAADDGTHIAKVRSALGVKKVPHVVEDVCDVLRDPERKVLLFAHHRAVNLALFDQLNEHGAKQVAGEDFYAVKLMGGDSPEDKQEAERLFMTDPKCRVFVGSITSANVGLNLTAADFVGFVEEDWVPSNMTQAEDRSHRRGQEKPVFVRHWCVRGSLDAHIAQLAVRKQEDADAAIDGDLAASEPVDWLADHAEARRIEEPGEVRDLPVREPKISELAKPEPLAQSAGVYALRRLVAEPKRYRVSDADFLTASRLVAIPVLTPRALAWADYLAKKYIPGKDST